MTQKEKQQLHEDVYQYLMELHREDDSFRFSLDPQSERLEKGYWFAFERDENILRTSFWKYADFKLVNVEMLPIFVIQILFNLDTKQWTLRLSALKVQTRCSLYAKKIAKQVNDFNKVSIDGDGEYHIWEKNYDIDDKDIFSGLNKIINEDKPLIDKFIEDNPSLEKTTESYKTNFLERFVDPIQDWSIDSLYFKNECLYTELWREFHRVKNSKEIKNDYGISRFYVSKFQGINELLIEGLPLNTQWIFLTGENAFGKTSILRAIAKGLVGDEDLVPPLPNLSQIHINTLFNKKPEYYRARPRAKPNFIIPVAAYGVSRFLLSGGDSTAVERSQQKAYSLFRDDGLLINIEQELITTNVYNPTRFEQLKKVFLKVIPNLKDIKIDTTNGSPKVRYCEKDNDNHAYEYITLNDLAAGYRSILTMIGDMVMRLSEVEGKDIDDLKGIVLIDEIDAHLHPKYQYELPKLLSDVFPKVQFIVTTHSPIPILGLPENNKPVVLTVERNSETGITIDRKDDDFDIRQLNPEALLTSPIFNFQTLFARGAKTETIIPTSDFKEVIDIEAIKKRLKNLREAGLVQ
jgi:hypothetical protein